MLQKNVPLCAYSNYKIGGKARYFYHARGLSDLRAAVVEGKRQRLPFFVLGGGTNLVISDSGFPGVVIKPDIQFISYYDGVLTVGAGNLVSNVLHFCADHGLSGLEWAGGLPGTIGGAVRGNAGAFGGEIQDTLLAVTSLDIVPPEPRLVRRDHTECRFGYRHSVFKELPQEIILEAMFRVVPTNADAVHQSINEKVIYREQRHPMEYPNVGSIFKNVAWESIPLEHRERFRQKVKHDPFPVVPTAVLIHECDLKGVSYGGAMVSPRHPNFIVNTLDATAADVKALIHLVKEVVREKFGVELEEEVQFV